MELKRLEVFGFKSFADRTTFEFDSGITCIVGPNGCGKSNVVDAVKWVLGEQSAKSLRGREMADVIFAGSESRRSLGFAEATLTFDNSRGVLPVDVPEVEVSRRLYRSGESEYLLNRKPCRLRDIRELFMDTGVGVDAYSLIEQGKVDVLLQSNPQERRLIFEEAAGISRYKAKRREAERKLARTEQNLVRLGDIVQEVERRLRSVKVQAGRARSWKEYNARLQGLRVSYALNAYDEHTRAMTEQQRDLDGLHDRRSAAAGRLADLDRRRADLEREAMDLQDQARQADARLSEIRTAISTAENEIGFHRTRADELRQVADRDRRKLGDLSAHLCEAERGLQTRRRDIHDIDQAAARQEAAVADIEDRLRAVSDRVRDLTERIETAKAEMLDLAQARTQAASRRAGLQDRVQHLDAQIDKLAARRDDIGRTLADLADRERALHEEQETLEAGVAERRGRLEATRHEAEARQADLEAVGSRLARAKEHASALDSRRSLLEDLQRRGEGIPEAVRQVTEAIQAEAAAVTGPSPHGAEAAPAPSWDGHAPAAPEPAAPPPGRWHGMVADLVDVDVAHARLVEAALGPSEKLIVADRRADVLALARRLQDDLPGQVRFLALDAVPPAANGRDLSAYAGTLGWAMDYVRAGEAVRPAVAHLLARTVVVETLDDAVRLGGEGGPLAGYRFVARSGAVLEADGSVAIGPPGPETSLISRRAELREVQGKREAVGRRIDTLEADRQRAVADLQALDTAQQQLRQEIYEASMRKVEVEAERRRLGENRQELAKERPVVESERADLARRREEDARAAEEADRRVADLARREGLERRRVAAMTGEQEEAVRRRDACEEERTEARVALAQLNEKRAAARDALAAAERDLEATRTGIEEARQELADCRRRITEADRTMLRLQSELADHFLAKESAEADVRRLAEARAEARRRTAEIAEEARTVQKEIDDLQARIHEVELARRESETKRDDLVARIRDEAGIDLADRYAAWEPEDVDWDAVGEEIRDLQGKIDRLGSVNLEAIDEQEDLQRRVTFLQQQQDDLTGARDTLADLIERINRESRQRFQTTFDAVRGHFQDLFRKLFGGGKADVFLEDEVDVLESGIEVVARPPGKQLQRISLLSGGEKTMTAVALLLAVFRARPSPFAILDEVDAALDESNIDRFTALVKEFLDQSQFVIISHNKRTMAIADVLYGVTMAEPGVSRKVSVKFADLHAQGFLTDEAEAEGAAGERVVAGVPVEVEAAISHAGAETAHREASAVEDAAGDAPEAAADAPAMTEEAPLEAMDESPVEAGAETTGGS
ncbi:MAG: chromosome segregation protein SMC [Phycisphaerae bacterium]